MRVLIISQHFWPEEFRINDLAAELQRRGVEVTVLTGWPNYPGGKIFGPFRADPASFDSFDGVPVLRVPLMPRGRAGGLNLVLNYLSFAASACTLGLFKLRRRRFDVSVVFLSSPATQALPAVMLRALTGLPTLLWVQDLWPQTLSAVGAVRSRAILGAVGAFVGWLYRSSAGVLIQSEAFREDVQRRAGPGVPVHYLPNWSEPNLAKGLDGVVAAPELAALDGTFKVMFAGNLGEAQDLPSIIRAAGLCRDITDLRWLIVGDGRARADAEAQVAESGLQGRVVFLGRHPSSRMPEFFKGADAMLVSLRKDPIFAMTVPSKVQSYMAAGRPIVGMLDGEGARVIGESGAGVVAPAEDAEALADAVRVLRSMSSGARSEMARKGRAYAQARFDRDFLVERLLVWMKEASAAGRGAER